MVRIFFSVVEEHYFLVYEAAGRILGDVVPRLAKRLEIQRSAPFQTFKPRYYSLAVYENGHRETLFSACISGESFDFYHFDKWKKFANRKKNSFSLCRIRARYVWRFLSFFSFFYFFLWNESLSLKSFRSMFFRDNFLYANCRKMYENISTLLVIQNIEIRNKIFNERWEWKLKLYNYFLTFNEYFFFSWKFRSSLNHETFIPVKKKKTTFDYAILRSIFYISRQKRNIIYRINARRAVSHLISFSFLVVGRNQPSDNFYSIQRHYN